MEGAQGTSQDNGFPQEGEDHQEGGSQMNETVCNIRHTPETFATVVDSSDSNSLLINVLECVKSHYDNNVNKLTNIFTQYISSELLGVQMCLMDKLKNSQHNHFKNTARAIQELQNQVQAITGKQGTLEEKQNTNSNTLECIQNVLQQIENENNNGLKEIVNNLNALETRLIKFEGDHETERNNCQKVLSQCQLDIENLKQSYTQDNVNCLKNRICKLEETCVSVENAERKKLWNEMLTNVKINALVEKIKHIYDCKDNDKNMSYEVFLTYSQESDETKNFIKLFELKDKINVVTSEALVHSVGNKCNENNCMFKDRSDDKLQDIMARLDRLDEEVKRKLQPSSVCSCHENICQIKSLLQTSLTVNKWAESTHQSTHPDVPCSSQQVNSTPVRNADASNVQSASDSDSRLLKALETLLERTLPSRERAWRRCLSGASTPSFHSSLTSLPGDDAVSKEETNASKLGKILFRAAEEGKIEDVRDLLACGAEVNTSSHGRCIALHAAAFRGYVEVLDALVDAGADLNAKNIAGYTPLHLAAQENQQECVQKLLAAGASPRVKSNRDKTPLDLAEKWHADKSAQLLRIAVAKETNENGNA